MGFFTDGRTTNIESHSLPGTEHTHTPTSQNRLIHLELVMPSKYHIFYQKPENISIVIFLTCRQSWKTDTLMILTFLTCKGVSLSEGASFSDGVSLSIYLKLVSQENTVVSNAQIWNTVQEWSCVTRILRKQDKGLTSSVSSKAHCSRNVFLQPSLAVDGSEFPPEHSSPLAAVCLYASMDVFAMGGFSCDCTLYYVTLVHAGVSLKHHVRQNSHQHNSE